MAMFIVKLRHKMSQSHHSQLACQPPYLVAWRRPCHLPRRHFGLTSMMDVVQSPKFRRQTQTMKMRWRWSRRSVAGRRDPVESRVPSSAPKTSAWSRPSSNQSSLLPLLLHLSRWRRQSTSHKLWRNPWWLCRGRFYPETSQRSVRLSRMMPVWWGGVTPAQTPLPLSLPCHRWTWVICRPDTS